MLGVDNAEYARRQPEDQVSEWWKGKDVIMLLQPERHTDSLHQLAVFICRWALVLNLLFPDEEVLICS